MATNPPKNIDHTFSLFSAALFKAYREAVAEHFSVSFDTPDELAEDPRASRSTPGPGEIILLWDGEALVRGLIHFDLGEGSVVARVQRKHPSPDPDETDNNTLTNEDIEGWGPRLN